MNEDNTSDTVLEDDGTDWDRLRRMSDQEARANALADPDAQPLSDGELDRMSPAPDVTRIRLRMRLTLTEFAERFGLNAQDARDWELRRSEPNRAERLLLYVIETQPEAVEQAAKQMTETVD